MNKTKIHILTAFLLVAAMASTRGMAQDNVRQSVLAHHTWHKIAVGGEGVFRLDYTTLADMGIDMANLDPRHIRIFGNESGSLGETNSDARPDDLTELAILVDDGGDGSFDDGDFALFYGQEPTRWILKPNDSRVYERDRNYYTDTTYYYLCVDSGTDGLRIASQASAPIDSANAIITEFPDFIWHEKELFSPSYIGRNWFGEMITEQDTLLEIQFILPNLSKDKTVYVKAQLMAQSRKQSTHYSIWANQNLLVNNGSIGAIPSDGYSYGVMAKVDKQMFVDSDTVRFAVGMVPNGNGHFMLLDFVEMYFWRQLKRVGGLFPFRLSPGQFGDGVSAIWVQNVDNSSVLWDVTNPLRPAMQQGLLSADNFVFATVGKAERRFFMFDPAAALPIGSWQPVANQNLHAIDEADAIIFTIPTLWEQANQLADFHLEKDGLVSVVVDVNEVYNEFSTGIPDPTALRDFVRMVYNRSHQRLKYVVLFGKASSDARNLSGYGRDFVPCYEEKYNSEQLRKNICTDDYFGLMDPAEGNEAAGRLDLGIGRIPVATTQEADAMIRKTKRYYDIATMNGEWKTEYMLLAGDDSEVYMNTGETAHSITDTMAHAVNVRKIYPMSYPIVQTPAGNRIPEAHDELIEAFNKGFLAMNYSGHGGVKGLTSVALLSLSDFPLLHNADRLPFVFTATCEFAKYDNPTFVSAGEQLYLVNDGGAGTLFTSSRPTNAQFNERLTKALMKALYRRDPEGKPMRFGDIIKAAKADQLNYVTSYMTTEQNKSVVYLFIGDPMLRLPLPEENIATLKINGKDPATNAIELHAMSMVTIEGEVRKHDGNPDNDFNGRLWLRLFDKASTAYESDSKHFTHFRDVIHKGCVSVKNGKFRASFQIPANINPDYGTPRFSYYAYDSIRGIDAMGVCDRLELGGTDPAMVPDDLGPQITFYWNTPDFKDGDLSERQGTLFADLYDAQGIYHYDFGLGRDILLGSNEQSFNNIVLNDRYEPALDDFRRGRVAIPIEGLKPGTYEFSLRVWDTQNNVSTAQLWFVVADDVFLSGVANYPNPFSEETNICIKHSGDDGRFHVRMQVFDATGRHVATVEDQMNSHNESVGPLRWNGRDQFGNPLPSGLYLYRLTLTGEDGFSRTVSQRMMIAR